MTRQSKHVLSLRGTATCSLQRGIEELSPLMATVEQAVARLKHTHHWDVLNNTPGLNQWLCHTGLQSGGQVSELCRVYCFPRRTRKRKGVFLC
uniref:Uncharacterized protein n=1 Tax=Knipowitschia caucasica TaxID=637954 RepID=A0AAV2M8P9_KNICA